MKVTGHWRGAYIAGAHRRKHTFIVFSKFPEQYAWICDVSHKKQVWLQAERKNDYIHDIKN